jgi:hypothetical protein
MSKQEIQIESLWANPPDSIGTEIEDSVMESVSRMPSPRVLHLRRRRNILAGMTMVTASIVLLFLLQNPVPREITNTDFVENRIYLANHTSIWLTPVVNQHMGK